MNRLQRRCHLLWLPLSPAVVRWLGLGWVVLSVCSCINPLTPDNPRSSFFYRLPRRARRQILWSCDFESATLSAWEDRGTDDPNAGGGIFVTDAARTGYGITRRRVHTGRAAAFAEVRAALSPGENKAVRFMRWTDKAWDRGGDYFPRTAYYSVFMFFPYVYDPGKPADNDPLNDGGWWNVFQFKSDNNAGSQPVVVLDVYHKGGRMFFGLVIKDYPDDDSAGHSQEYVTASNPSPIPAGRWVHVEMRYDKDAHYGGRVVLWQDGRKLVDRNGVRTVLPPAETAAWGIGNYTDYITGGNEPGRAIVYFDDAVISTGRISRYLDE